MRLKLQDVDDTLFVSEKIFNCDFNEALVHQVVVAYASRGRQGTRAQKTRAEVAGSGKKPWRQKGTGRARSGSINSPIWRSGGVTFAASPRNYYQKINKKMYRGAIKSIISMLVRQDRLIVVKEFSITEPKTRLLIQKLKSIFLENVFIITNEMDKKLFLAARNLHKVSVSSVTSIDPISLITYNKVVITADAVKEIEDMLI